ncbi:MAG: type II toxin-antitoxin system HicB family antitoxin [Bryobacterales bacterium]|nr:type II toxin-antitoxin system HicB family antitoxin [Bryobacterales bacterium]
MRTFSFPAALVNNDDDGTLTVTFRDLPEAITSGQHRADALLQAADCLEEAIAGRIADGLDIPHATKARRGERLISLPATMAAKAALYLAIRESGLANTKVARRLGLDEKEVRRMLDPRHNTQLGRIQDALGKLGKRLLVSVEEAA